MTQHVSVQRIRMIPIGAPRFSNGGGVTGRHAGIAGLIQGLVSGLVQKNTQVSLKSRIFAVAVGAADQVEDDNDARGVLVLYSVLTSRSGGAGLQWFAPKAYRAAIAASAAAAMKMGPWAIKNREGSNLQKQIEGLVWCTFET